jgi:ATP-dependent DNA ligase
MTRTTRNFRPPVLPNRPLYMSPRLRVPEGPEWIYEIKLDGYRLEAAERWSNDPLFPAAARQ